MKQMLETPLPELGRQPEICSGCICNRQKCGYCWVEKNLWEVRQTRTG